MRYVFFLALTVFFVACNHQRNFSVGDAHKVAGKRIDFSGRLHRPIVRSNGVSAVLLDNTVVLDSGVTDIRLSKYQDLVFHNDNFWVIDNECKSIDIVPVSVNHGRLALTWDAKRSVQSGRCLVSASIDKDLLAYVLSDNSMHLYDMGSESSVFEYKGDGIYAITNVSAAPVFSDNTVVYPALDGRLCVYDLTKGVVVRNIIVGSDKFLNNILYLKLEDDTLVAATKGRVFTMVGGSNFTKDIELVSAALIDGFVYVLGVDGSIYKLDKALAVSKEVKLPFAQLSGLVVMDGTLYTIEKGSRYLVTVDVNSFDYDVFRLSVKRNDAIFHTRSVFYVRDKFLDIGSWVR